MTAAPLPGVSPPRFGSRAAAGRTGNAAPVIPNPGLNHLARRDIPARRRATNGLEAVGTNNPLLAGYRSGSRNDARLTRYIGDRALFARGRSNWRIANLPVTRKRRNAGASSARFRNEGQTLNFQRKRDRSRPCSLPYFLLFALARALRRPQKKPASRKRRRLFIPSPGRRSGPTRMLAYFV